MGDWKPDLLRCCSSFVKRNDESRSREDPSLLWAPELALAYKYHPSMTLDAFPMHLPGTKKCVKS
jgi:hypothetical protein